jgi:serine/threonine-protein kinase
LKSCPICQRVYPDDAGFCPADGTALSNASMVPIAPAADDPRIGSKLYGRYEIRRVVADGGMGRVYEGIDKQTNTRIAVKVLHDDVAQDDVAVERFKREYDLSSSLPHDHIVHVLDFKYDDAQKVWLLVMEFLDGEELRVILKREKTIPPERVIRMLSQVALGLDASHAKNFVHRDLKPDNLFLCGTREGDIVKILDFGSVKDKNKDAKKLTVLGTTIGSPFYMAPEQAQGLETLDARADVFALAAITYECVTGKVPFEGSNGPSILLAIMTKEPDPPSQKGAGAKHPPPPGLDLVMEEALAKNPNIRTKTVGALADAVGRAYGLDGDHHVWATTPQAELGRKVAEAAPRVMAKKAASLEAAGDPFASAATAAANVQRDPFAQPARGPSGTVAIPGSHGGIKVPGPPPSNPEKQMDRAFSAVREAEVVGGDGADAAYVVPTGRPSWLIPVVIGVAALFVGGMLAALIALVK